MLLSSVASQRRMCLHSPFPPPSRRHADIIVPWQSSENVVAIDLITEHIRLKLRQHDLIRIYSNLEVRGAGLHGAHGRGGPLGLW